MMKETIQKTKYRKRSAAAALIVLSLLAAGCGSAAKDEHAQHAATNESNAAANEQSGHTSNTGSNEACENHSQHGGKAEHASSSEADVKLEWRFSPENPKPGEETKIELFLSDASGK